MGLELLLPVVFFLITLIIIYLLRVEDRRDRRLDLIKKRMGDFSAEVERVIQNFRDSAQITEERITKRAESSKALTARLDEQLSDLQGRSDDLSKLQEVLNTYRDSISRLGATTATVEGRIGQVRREVERLETVNAKIQEFDRRLAERSALFERSIQEEDARYEAFSKSLERRYEEYRRENEQLRAQGEAFIEESRSRFSELEQHVESQVAEQQNTLTAIQSRFETLTDQSREALDSLCKQTDETCRERLLTFAGECDRELQTMVQTATDRIDDAFKTMVGVIISFIQELEDRASQSEELNALLVRQQQANLAEYSEEIQLLQQLSTQSESAVRRDELRRRELMEVRTHLREETLALRAELDQMIGEKQALLSANAQAKQEQENLQSALAHLSLSLIERQDELIRSNDTDEERFEAEAGIEASTDDLAPEQEEIVADNAAPVEAEELTDETMGDEETELPEEVGFNDVQTPDEDEIGVDKAPPTEAEEPAGDDAETGDEEMELPEDAGFDDAQTPEEDEIVVDTAPPTEAEAPAGDDAEGAGDDEPVFAEEEPSLLAVPDEKAEILEEVAALDEASVADSADSVEEDNVGGPPDPAVQGDRAWVEYIPEGDEEEISLDDEDDLNP